MGTRSTTHIYETDKITAKRRKPLVSIYRQMDGYPSGMGKELADFIKDIKIVNGIGFNVVLNRIANGAGCFAAQLIKHLKHDVGSIYITTADDRQQYDYHLYVVPSSDPFKDDGYIWVIVREGKKKLFEGTAKDFAEWCDTYVSE